MTFEYVPNTGAHMPPELEGLYPLQSSAELSGLGLVPFLIAGVAAGGAVAVWLQNDDWSVGTYNNIVRKMDATIADWDELGWSTGCWQKYPAQYKRWLAFWGRFSKHFGTYGIISEWGSYDRKFTGFVPDSAERPLRNDLLPELERWGQWLNATCGAGTASVVQPNGDNGTGPTRPTDWGRVAMWGGIGLTALVALQVVGTVRGAFK